MPFPSISSSYIEQAFCYLYTPRCDGSLEDAIDFLRYGMVLVNNSKYIVRSRYGLCLRLVIT